MGLRLECARWYQRRFSGRIGSGRGKLRAKWRARLVAMAWVPILARGHDTHPRCAEVAPRVSSTRSESVTCCVVLRNTLRLSTLTISI